MLIASNYLFMYNISSPAKVLLLGLFLIFTFNKLLRFPHNILFYAIYLNFLLFRPSLELDEDSFVGLSSLSNALRSLWVWPKIFPLCLDLCVFNGILKVFSWNYSWNPIWDWLFNLLLKYFKCGLTYSLFIFTVSYLSYPSSFTLF